MLKSPLFLFLIQVFTAGCNHILIPVIAVFWNPLHIFEIQLIPVDIDKTIPIAVSLMGADKIHKRPGTAARSIHTVADGGLCLMEMALQSVNAAGIMNPAVFQNILGAQTVFCDEEGKMVPVINSAQSCPQSDGIDLPAKFGNFQIVVGTGPADVFLTGHNLLISPFPTGKIPVHEMENR